MKVILDIPEHIKTLAEEFFTVQVQVAELQQKLRKALAVDGRDGGITLEESGEIIMFDAHRATRQDLAEMDEVTHGVLLTRLREKKV